MFSRRRRPEESRDQVTRSMEDEHGCEQSSRRDSSSSRTLLHPPVVDDLGDSSGIRWWHWSEDPGEKAECYGKIVAKRSSSSDSFADTLSFHSTTEGSQMTIDRCTSNGMSHEDGTECNDVDELSRSIDAQMWADLTHFKERSNLEALWMTRKQSSDSIMPRSKRDGTDAGTNILWRPQIVRARSFESSSPISLMKATASSFKRRLMKSMVRRVSESDQAQLEFQKRWGTNFRV